MSRLWLSTGLSNEIAEVPKLFPRGTRDVVISSVTMLLIGKEPTDVLLPTWPTIGTFTVVEIIDKCAAIVFNILFHPKFTVLVLTPLSQSDKIRTLTIALVVSPLTDIQFPISIPMGAATGANAPIKIAIIDRFGDERDRNLKTAPAMKLTASEISEIFTLTPFR